MPRSISELFTLLKSYALSGIIKRDIYDHEKQIEHFLFFNEIVALQVVISAFSRSVK